MTPDEYRALDGVALADLVRRGEVTAREVADAASAVIAAANPALNAVVRRVDPERRIDGLKLSAPLVGVPFLLKDIGAQCAGLPTTAGNRWLARVQGPAPRDDELVARFHRAGLVTMGQTNTPDLGMNVTTEPLLFGPTRNPVDAARSPGGSSGGAAAAVAAGMVPIAHATDGAGSIRVPAACCGLVGLKPSRGAIPDGPGAAHVYQGLVASFVVSRTVRDSAAALAAVHGSDAGARYSAPPLSLPPCGLARLRVAMDASVPSDVRVEPAAVAAMLHVGRRLEGMGHRVEAVALPLDEDDLLLPRRLYAAQVRVQTAVMVDAIAAATGEPPVEAEFEPVLWAALEEGRRMSAVDLVHGEWRMHALARKLAPFFAAWDVLLTPAIAAPAWKLGSLPTDHHDVDLHVRRMLCLAPFTAMWNPDRPAGPGDPVGADGGPAAPGHPAGRRARRRRPAPGAGRLPHGVGRR